MEIWQDCCAAVDDILLPTPGVDMEKWAVVACDQYSSQPEYWDKLGATVGNEPSTLHIIYPEAYLAQGDARITAINAAMKSYIEGGVLAPAVHGFVLVERHTQHGNRLGLVLTIDLEAYDFTPGSESPIRPTEGTILERIPPRVRIREHACVETPHVMLLMDDPQRQLIEPLYATHTSLRPLYNFDTVCEGGHIRGWAVEGERLAAVHAVLANMKRESPGIFIAVGDGNHSLATARQCWLNLRGSLTEAERRAHPARFALAEVVNLHDESLVFEPVHRVLFNVDAGALIADFADWCAGKGMKLSAVERAGAVQSTGNSHAYRFIDSAGARDVVVNHSAFPIDVGTLQTFIDEWLSAHPASGIDYVHGEAALRGLACKAGNCGIMLGAMDKATLFPAVEQGGPLPRKTFSMGEAWEKRYYLECRTIAE